MAASPETTLSSHFDEQFGSREAEPEEGGLEHEPEERFVPRDTVTEVSATSVASPPRLTLDDADDDDADDDEAEAPPSRAQKRIHQEIERRKQLETQLEEQRRFNERAEQRLQLLLERYGQQPAKPEEAPPAPEFDSDPAGHLLYQQDQTRQQLAAIQQALVEQQTSQQQVAQHQQLQQHISQLEAQYAKEHDDYLPRVAELERQRVSMWQSMGLSLQDARTTVAREALAVAQQALRAGKNPAEYFHQMAPQVAKPAAEEAPAASRTQRPRGLGSRGGTPKAPSLADIARMSDAEFDKVAGDEDAWRELHRRAGLL